MTWDQTMVTTLRVLINDTESPQDYTDNRLKQIIVVAAEYTQSEIAFDQAYTINIETTGISPDPVVLNTTESTAFWTIATMKAACLVDQSLYRTKALLAGVTARCGPAVLATLGHIRAFKDLIDFGPCKSYESLKEEFEFGNATVGEAVLSPFVSNNYYPLYDDSLVYDNHRYYN